MREILVALLLWIAGIFTFIAAIGIVRLPDFYLRMHASTKAGVVGVIASLMALALNFDDPATRVRAILIALFVWITAPIVAHALSRAALIAGVPLSPNSVHNDWDQQESALTPVEPEEEE